MDITSKRIRTYSTLALVLVGLSHLACTADDSDPGPEDGGTGGSDGSGGAGTGGGGPSGTVCAAPIVLDEATPGIADFEDYDPDSIPELGMWSFPMGGDVSTGIYTGPFGYGDEASGLPETFEMTEGNDSEYALRIADTLAEEYGGGMGLWLSECLDVSAFSGISFWVRGDVPLHGTPAAATATFSLMMQETTPSADGDSVGTCEGTTEQCVHPHFSVPVTDEWTEVRIAWSDFTAGDAAGTRVVPDGTNVWQVQFQVELDWQPEEPGSDVYVPTPAPYELEVDDLTFY